MTSELVVVAATGVRDIAARAQALSADLIALRELMDARDWLPEAAWLSGSAITFASAAAHAEVAYFGSTPMETQLASLQVRILLAAELYERAETAAQAVVDAAGQAVANAVGRAVPLMVALVGPAVGIAALIALASGGAGTLSTSSVQELIRVSVEHADEFALGLAGLPPLAGVDQTALVALALAAAGTAGRLPADRFRITSTGSTLTGLAERGGEAPTGLQQVVAAIPPSLDGGPQVRITTYVDEAGRQLYEVAITGTSSQQFGTTSNPFDLAGNLAAFSGLETQSVAAVLAAMATAGVEPGDAVVLAGYSQGALVAAAIAGLGRYDVKGLVSIGGPIDATRIGGSAPVVEIQHAEDPIVGLQGLAPDGDHSTVVIANAADHGPFAPDDPLAGHSQERYVQTAGRVDASADAALAAARAQLLAAYDGCSLEETSLVEVQRLETAATPSEEAADAAERVEQRFAPIVEEIEEALERTDVRI